MAKNWAVRTKLACRWPQNGTSTRDNCTNRSIIRVRKECQTLALGNLGEATESRSKSTGSTGNSIPRRLPKASFSRRGRHTLPRNRPMARMEPGRRSPPSNGPRAHSRAWSIDCCRKTRRRALLRPEPKVLAHVRILGRQIHKGASFKTPGDAKPRSR
jgi:hypothetical protein